MHIDKIIHALFDLYPAEKGHIDRDYSDIHSDFTGAQVLLVDIYAHPNVDDAYEGKAFAKIDHTEYIRQEYKCHTEALEDDMDYMIPAVIEDCIFGEVEGYSMLLFRPAQRAINNAQTFSDVLNAYSANQYATNDIVQQVQAVVSEVLRGWQDINRLIKKRQSQPVHELLITLFNRGNKNRYDDLVERVQTQFALSPDKQQILFLHKTQPPNNAIILPNPLYYIKEAETNTTLRLRIARTPIHGDLHAGNVICRLDNGGKLTHSNPQVLDLALYERRGLIFFDLAQFELDILIRCLPTSNDQDWSDWLALIGHLNESEVLPQGTPYGIRPPIAWALIKPIRERVFNIINQIHEHFTTVEEDYTAAWWLSVWSAGLAVSRSTTRTPQTRSAALLYSAWALKRLLQFFKLQPEGMPLGLQWVEESGLNAQPVTTAKQTEPVRFGKLWNVPPIHDHYLKRDEDLKRLIDLVLHYKTAGLTGGKSTALQGMGGIGKTVMAAMVCHTPDVQQAFPDGILWLTFGTQPQVERLQAQLSSWIEGKPAPFSDVDSLRLHLIGLLENKKCLLVLDDIWDIKHTRGFTNLGETVTLLVTTRSQTVMKAMQANRHILNLLSPQEARLLLRQTTELETLPPEAENIIKECGGLPLALAMIGAALKEKPTNRWKTMVRKLRAAQLEHIKTATTEYEYNNLWAVIEVSVKELKLHQQKRYLDFAVFPDDAIVPEAVLITLWKPEQLDEDETLELIDELTERSLLLRDSVGVKLHDLQLDYVCRRVETDYDGGVKGLHQRLLNAYNPKNDHWHTIEHDGYLYFQLAYHLKTLSRLDELHNLLISSPEWREAKFKQCEGDTSYTDDLKQMTKEFHEPLTADEVVKLAQLYAAQQVVHARTSRYTDIDLKTLVWLNRTSEALSYARLRSLPESHFDGLIAIYETLRIKDKQANILLAEKRLADRLLGEAFDLVFKIISEDEYHRCLYRLITQFLENGIYDQVGRMIEIVRTHSGRADALCALAIALAQAGDGRAATVFDQAWKVTNTIEDTSKRADALCALAIALAQAGDGRAATVFDQAWKVTNTIEDTSKRADASRRLAAALAQTGDGRAATVFDQAWKDTNTIEDISKRADALRKLTVVLAQHRRFEQAQKVANTIKNTYNQAFALCALAVTLAQAGDGRAATIFEQVRKVANTIKNTYNRSSALYRLAIDLAQQQRFEQAREVANAIDHASRRDSALRDIAVVLVGQGRFEESRQVVNTIKDISKRADALRILATSLASAGDGRAATIFEQVRKIVNVAEDASKRDSSLRVLATALAQHRRFEQAQEVVNTIEDASIQASALVDLAAALAQQQWFDRAREVANMIDNASKQADALRELAVALGQYHRFEQGLDVINTIKDASRRADALYALAVVLVRQGHFEQAYEVANTIEITRFRDAALRELTTVLARQGHFEQAWEIANIIDDAFKRADALREVAVALVHAGDGRAAIIFDQSREVINTIKDVSSRDSALRELIIVLARQGHFEQAFDVTNTIKDAFKQADALRELAVALGQYHRFEQAFDVTNTIKDASKRADALRDIAVALAQDGDGRAATIFDQAWKVINSIEDTSKRAASLRKLAVAFDRVGDERALTVFEQTHEVANTINDILDRASVLHDVTISLVQRQRFEQAREVANTIENASKRADTLRDITTSLIQRQRFEQAREVANTIENASKRADALRELATALVKTGQVCIGFEILGVWNFPQYLQSLTAWSEKFELIENDLFIRVMRATLPILAWEKESWNDIAKIIAPRFRHGYALVIGIGETKDEKLSLPVTVEDAKSIGRFLRRTAGYGQVKVLTNDQATKANIEDGFKWLQNCVKADSDAVAFIYYSGHGGKRGEDYFLIPHETDRSRLDQTAIPVKTFDGWLQSVRARKTIAFLDCCYAGSASLTKSDLPFTPAAPDFKLMASGEGRVLVASSSHEQTSHIAPNAANSIFTEVLLEGLGQPGEVDVVNLWQKLRKEVPERAERYGWKQNPRLNTTDLDTIVLAVNPPQS